MYKKYQTWSEEENATLVALKDKGISSKEIARSLGRTVSAVDSQYCNIKKKYKVVDRKEPQHVVETTSTFTSNVINVNGTTIEVPNNYTIEVTGAKHIKFK